MRKNINILQALGFTENYINKIARDTGFIKRCRKLSGLDYLTILLFNVSKEVISYNTMASTALDNFEKSVYKQALHKAMSKEAFILFINRIFNELLQSKLGISNNKIKSKFKRIIIQDSTIIKLPQRLFEHFSGVKNNTSQVANARIQLALDIKSMFFNHFSIDPYYINDVLAAPKLIIRKGYLIIRDRGYCSIGEIKRILKYKADFIFRYYHGFKYYDINTGQVINIYKLLKNKSKLKIKLNVGSADGPAVILLAARVNEDIANRRRSQLKKTAKHPPSTELLQLLSWSIFFTSLEDEEITFEDIFSLYRLRWRIEIIFKAMKSHLNLDKIHKVSMTQLTFILIGKMILFLLITQFIYAKFCHKVHERTGKIISLIKLVRYLKDNINMISELLKINKKKINIYCDSIRKLINYCTYDRRIDRKNYEQEFIMLFLS